MPLRMRGGLGELRSGYKVAARLNSWEMDESGSVQATASDVNEFLLDQGGKLAVWLWVGKRAWVWRQAEVVARGTPFVLRVEGSPEVRD